jgi:hypothetical protein
MLDQGCREFKVIVPAVEDQPKKYHEDISESTNVGNERNNVIDLA